MSDNITDLTDYKLRLDTAMRRLEVAVKTKISKAEELHKNSLLAIEDLDRQIEELAFILKIKETKKEG